MSTPPTCGAQQPGSVPNPFDWWLLGGIVAGAGAVAWVWGNGVPVANQLINLLYGAAPLTSPGWGITSAAAGAAAVIILVGYYLFKADGCIVSPKQGEPVCVSGIVEAVTDLNNTAVNVLAPFAIGPEAEFYIVVKSQYWNLTTKNAYWVFCSQAGGAMLLCIVKSATSCAARIGAAAGAVVGGIAGVVAGYLAGAAIASLGCGPFAFLCFILACIVAAIVAAAITYAGADVGGLIGEGIANAASSDPTGSTAKSLTPGAIVTVKGNWITDPDVGNDELYYVTDISRTGNVTNPPSYTTADADATPADDCPPPSQLQ